MVGTGGRPVPRPTLINCLMTQFRRLITQLRVLRPVLIATVPHPVMRERDGMLHTWTRVVQDNRSEREERGERREERDALNIMRQCEAKTGNVMQRNAICDVM